MSRYYPLSISPDPRINNCYSKDSARRSKVTNLSSKIIQLFLGLLIFLSHLFILGLPLVAGLLEGLYFAFKVAGLDIGLS